MGIAWVKINLYETIVSSRMKWSLEITISYPWNQCWSKVEESDARFGDNQGIFFL